MSNPGNGIQVRRRKPILPIKRPIKGIIGNMKALTHAEAAAYRYEPGRAGCRTGGVGLVRVANSKEIYWTVVRCNDLDNRQCQFHHEDMSLMKTVEETDFNQKNAIFFRCEVELKVEEDQEDTGEILTCGNNFYPIYPRERFLQEHGQPDHLKPILYEDEKKKEAEIRRQAGQ